MTDSWDQRGLPIVTPAEMGAIDAAAPEPVEELIERAGAAVTRSAVEMLGGTYGRRVVVVAGKGNNGNDGRSAARKLRRRGVRVTVLDAADLPISLPPCDLLVDAAYGTGFAGEWSPPPAPAPVLAVDIPTGVTGDEGQLAGSPWSAARTVTFAALKPGLVLGAGPNRTGEVKVADIGLDTSGARAHLLTDEAVADLWPGRPHDAHKWRAACWIIGGSPGMTGAPRLAAAAAGRAGAGYVRLSIPGETRTLSRPIESVGRPLPEADWAEPVLADLDRIAALLIGPGLGRDPAAGAGVRAVAAAADTPLVLDGDALWALGPEAGPVLADRNAPTVLTPHDGEYERLCGRRPEADRLAAARTLADTTGAVVLLKGPATVVAAPGGSVLVATAGDERLATAGTGDVLAGIVAALLACGAEPLAAAGCAAHIHGRAGALGWRRGLVASDLIDLLPVALADILED